MLIHLTLTFALMSLLAVGGGTAVIPEMQSVLRQQFGLDHTQFVHIYSMGQLAPGPNMLMVLVIGMQLAGALGAATVFLSFFLPSSLLCFYAGRLWEKIGESPWRRAVQNALEPISIGLMVSGVYAVGKSAITNEITLGLTALAFLLLLLTKLNPVLAILGSGVVYSLVTLTHF